MGDNKISEAVVEAAVDAWRASEGAGARDLMRDAIEAAFAHLQGEAVPVGYVDLANLRAGLPSEECFYIAWQDDDTVPVYLHPQPAELSEVSGDSGELGHLEVRRFIAKRVTSPEHRQNVLDGDYDETDWFGHVRAALNVGREQNPQSPVAWRRRHPKEDGTWFDWIYSDGEPARKYQTSQYEPLFALDATGKQQVGEVQDK